MFLCRPYFGKNLPSAKTYLEIYPSLLLQKFLIILFEEILFCLEYTKCSKWIACELVQE